MGGGEVIFNAAVDACGLEPLGGGDAARDDMHGKNLLVAGPGGRVSFGIFGAAAGSAGGRFWTGAGWHLQGGFPARLRAGARLSPEKAGGKSAGGKPPGPPSFIARSFSLARFGVGSAAGQSWGYYSTHVRTLIWRLSFTKNAFQYIFLENASQIGFNISKVIA